MPILQPKLMKQLMKFAIFGNTYQPKKFLHALRLFELLKKQGAEICMCREFYQFLTADLKMEVPVDALLEGNDFTADMVISIGGDGTFLKAARRVGRKQIPILGINTGRLGFLADVSPEEMEVTFEEIQAGRYSVEERSVLQLICNDRNLQESPYALNEIAVLKRDSSSMISIRTAINGAYLNTYQADGLVIATPTGSTAYSLSVGGPIIVPHSNTIAITPVAPHSLNVRPIVIRDDWEITLDVESRSHNFLVAIDGSSETCKETTQLTIRRADYSIKVVKRFNHIFFDTLRSKMMWGADGRR
ncbi:NAD kinase [Bacteroides sp. HMSC067B03]|uniref:NAD kinase n=1 Tax=Bacteroides sp. HMSC067B03 TaxID=1739298 RepID=UPI0008A5684E|nr:NAD kinase [Bacteroides sp. HMSC067B03]OFK88023.1 NAD kinase [Bacteroides sp. HMSC067B03]